MTWWVVRVLLALVGLAGVVAVVGWMLPVAHVASGSSVVPQPVEAVFIRIADVAAYPTWWPDVTRVDVLLSVDGRSRFREHMSTGAIVFETVEAASPRRFVSRIADPDQPFGGTWTFELAPEATGTRVTITERGEVYNPIFRFMSRFVFSQTSTLESCLAALVYAARRSSRPEPSAPGVDSGR